MSVDTSEDVSDTEVVYKSDIPEGFEFYKDEYVVYDISVKDNHTYYVGQDSVLVYNEKITNIY